MFQVRKSVVAKFELANILLEGHCFDEVTGNPPRGLQFILGTDKHPNRYDTIVMANLVTQHNNFCIIFESLVFLQGYFQLKATPGAWTLKLREGKSSDIYEVKSCTESELNNDDRAIVLIDNFMGKTVRIRVTKKAGMEKRNLLTDTESNQPDSLIQNDDLDEDEGKSIWSSISRYCITSILRVVVVVVVFVISLFL